jgi:hypothetical protein
MDGSLAQSRFFHLSLLMSSYTLITKINLIMVPHAKNGKYMLGQLEKLCARLVPLRRMSSHIEKN